MNPKYHLLFAAAALSLNACSTDDTYTVPENEGRKISFTVAEDTETRTTLEMLDAGNFLRWVSTDKVGIYTGGNSAGNNVNSNVLTTADVSKSPVEFSGSLHYTASPGEWFYAYYPYNAEQSTDPTAVKLSIPVEQKQTQEGVYNGESHPLVAVPMEFLQEWGTGSHINSVRFRQLGAIVELQLYSSDETLCTESIASVAFESETALAGDFTFDLTSVTIKDALPISGYESKTVTTTLKEVAVVPATKDEAARVYLTIAPGRYTGRIVVTTNEAQYTFTLAKAITFDRAAIKGLPADLAKAERKLFSDDPITFEDPEVKQICVDNWDTNKNGELSYKEAAAVTDLKEVFKSNSNITSFNELQYFTGLQTIESNTFQYCSYLTSITIPETVTSIGYGAFYNCTGLTSIHIPDGVTSIGEQAFYYCTRLTSITIPKGVTTIEKETFYYCNGLTSINLNGVTTIGERAFGDCSSLTSVNIPETVTSIGSYAFSGCSSLTSVNIPETVTSIGGYAFSGCSSLTSINIPETVTTIGEYAFSLCSKLTSINIPAGVTTIERNAFQYCSSLTSIHIPEKVTSIGEYAFFRCSKLSSINIPVGVTTISSGVFRDCSDLTSITIPEGVTEINDQSFYGCSSLTSIYCKPSTPPTLGYSGVFYDTPSTMQIYVPTNSVEAYKTAEYWSTYASQIFADNN